MGVIMKDDIPYGGIYPIDDAPTQGSNNAVKSGGVHTALAGKQDTLTFDNVPTQNSNNPVKSGGVYSADKALSDTMAANGAHNLLPFDLASIKATNTGGTWNNNAYSYNGVTFTLKEDGTVDVSADGVTNTQDAPFVLLQLASGYDRSIGYKLQGCPANGSGSTYSIVWRVGNKSDGSFVTSYLDIGAGADVSHLTSSQVVTLYIDIKANTAINATFKPLIKLATDPSTEYTPYAMTNRELTDICKDIPNNLFKYYSATAIDDFETLPLGVVAINTNSSTLHHPPSSANAFIVFTTGGWSTYYFRMQLAMSYWTNEIFMRIAWGGVSYDVWKKLTTS